MKNNYTVYQSIKNYFSTMYCIVPFIRYIFASSSTIKMEYLNSFKMKTSRILSVAVLLTSLVMTHVAAASVPLATGLNEPVQSYGTMVKAILDNGNYIPVVDLPEVEIIASRLTPRYVKGVIQHGEIMALVELPVVEISVSKLRQVENNKAFDYEAIYDIPVIEIEGTFPSQNLIKGKLDHEESIAVVNLPEVTIVVDKTATADWITAFQGTSGKLNNQPGTLQITHPDVKLIIEQFNSVNKQLADVSISLENCIMNNEHTFICEFVSDAGEAAAAGLRKGILKLIFK